MQLAMLYWTENNCKTISEKNELESQINSNLFALFVEKLEVLWQMLTTNAISNALLNWKQLQNYFRNEWTGESN